MISKLSKSITNMLIRNNKIHNDESELYHYAFFIIISEFILFVYCLLIGAIFNVVLQALVFSVVFYVLHRFAGGFHAKTELQCQAVTLSFFLLCIWLIKFTMQFNPIYLIITYIVSCIFLMILSPSDTPQKQLSTLEKTKFKKITILLVIICSAIIALLFCFKSTVIYANSIIIGVILETLSVVFGRLFNYKLLSE
ncbi:MAG: accessory gene regulator B family protein [Eubacterium sp.]|nr:accessory gene regulator B family protein [Eubacterium sp.]